MRGLEAEEEAGVLAGFLLQLLLRLKQERKEELLTR